MVNFCGNMRYQDKRPFAALMGAIIPDGEHYFRPCEIFCEDGGQTRETWQSFYGTLGNLVTIVLTLIHLTWRENSLYQPLRWDHAIYYGGQLLIFQQPVAQEHLGRDVDTWHHQTRWKTR